MRIISTSLPVVNVAAPAPQSGPVAGPTPSAPADPGALATLSHLDVDGSGRIDHVDVTALAAKVPPGATAGPAVWEWNQARILQAYDAQGAGTTVRGLLQLGHVPAPAAPNGNLAGSDVREGVRLLDTSKLRAAGVPLVAAFDYDDTIAHGDVFIPVMKALAARGQFDAAGDDAIRAALATSNVPTESIDRGDVNDRAALLAGLIVPAGSKLPVPGAKPIAISDAFYAFGAGMRGMDAAAATEVVADAFERGVPEAGVAPLRTELFDGPAAAGDSAREMTDTARAAGLDPWIVSWGYDFIAKVAAPYAGVAPDHVLGSEMAIGADGRFTGLRHEQSIPKSAMIRDAIGVPPVISFGNSSSDLPMLDATVGPTFLVRPEAQPKPLTDAVAQRAGRTWGMDYALPSTAS